MNLSVLPVSRRQRVTTVLKSERPWNPTGVALRDGDVYVLEWTHANGGANDATCLSNLMSRGRPSSSLDAVAAAPHVLSSESGKLCSA